MASTTAGSASPRGGSWRVIGFAVLLLAVALGANLLPPTMSDIIILGMLCAFGVIGVIASFVTLSRGAAAPRSDAGGAMSTVGSALLESVPEGALLVDAKGKPLYANTAFLRLAGVEDEALLKPVEQLFSASPDAAEAIFRLASAAGQRRRAVEEVRMPHAIDTGEPQPRWYKLRVCPVPAETAGTSAGHVLWLVADVTREREHQENIFKELQNAIDYLDHAPAGFFSMEPDGRLRYLNATLAGWLGLDLAEFEPGRIDLADVVSAEGLSLMNAIRHVPGETTSIVVDLDIVRRNGTRMPVRLLHRVPVSPSGQVGTTRTIVLDASPGEGSLEPGHLAEIRFSRFFNNTPIAIASIDAEGRFDQANAQFISLFGAPEEGRKITEAVAPGDRHFLMAAIDAAMGGSADVPPVDTTFASDPDRSARFFISPVIDGEGGGVVVFALETTKQRALEEQFAQSQKMQAVGQLAGGIAHDFNNLLTAIIGFSDLLLARLRPTDPSFQDIMNIKQNATRAASLVRQLLAFSRRQTLRPQKIDLDATLNDLTVLLDRLLGEKVKLKMRHGRDLWPVRADLSQLEQVIVNLAVNARDAMLEGGHLAISTENISEERSREFRYRGFTPGEYVLIEVADDGTGIPDEIVDRIFDPFFTTKDINKGTGLGLSTVYGIIKQTEGFIYVDTKQGEGTTFRIFLPRHVSVEPEEAQVKAKPKHTDLTGNATVLLVEDEDSVRVFARRALESRGYIVHEASTGAEALDLMEETGGAIDIVVSDVMMPEMDGPQLLHELRKSRPDLKIIFVSGYAEEAFAKHMPDNETFQFLPKPFNLKDLATAVKTTLEA